VAARAATTAVYQAWNPAARSAAMATGAAATAAGNDATAPTGWSGSCPSHDSSYAETTANHPATYSRHQHGAEAGLLSNDATSEATILG